MLGLTSLHAAAQVPAPPNFPVDCPALYPVGGYLPAQVFGTLAVDEMHADPARGNHDVPFRVRYPVGGPAAPYPVVFWNHGGGVTEVIRTTAGRKITVGQKSSACRGDHMARAGYVVIHIGRLPLAGPLAGWRLDCLKAGWLTAESCRSGVGHHVYGPQNIPFLIAKLQAQPLVLPGFNGTLDWNRVLVGGWSGGSTMVLNIAGAPQRIGELQIPSTPVPSVRGFIGDAPKGPVWGGFPTVGFQEQAFFNIDTRPFLTITGRSDFGEEDELHKPVARTMSWLSARRGSKYISWTRVSEAEGGPIHGTMDLSNCTGGARPLFCQWFLSLTTAYLDAVLRNSASARSWLDSDAYSLMTSGAAELHRR